MPGYYIERSTKRHAYAEREVTINTGRGRPPVGILYQYIDSIADMEKYYVMTKANFMQNFVKRT